MVRPRQAAESIQRLWVDGCGSISACSGTRTSSHDQSTLYAKVSAKSCVQGCVVVCGGTAGAASAMSRPCLFCAIVAGQEPAQVVYEDDLCLGFLDSKPLFAGHTLIVPKVHYETLGDLPDHLHGTLFSVVARVSRVMPGALGAGGTFVAMNNVVSQSVPHLHVHVVPRTKGDGLRGFFWPRTSYGSPAVAAAIAERLRLAVQAEG